jgi:hypothetical protein
MKREMIFLIFLLETVASVSAQTPIKPCPRGAFRCYDTTPQKISFCYKSFKMLDEQGNEVCNFDTDLERLKGYLNGDIINNKLVFDLILVNDGYANVRHYHPLKFESTRYAIANPIKGSYSTEITIYRSGYVEKKT